ncbi:hypothetical protein H2200_006293 [Cladophialophora chaetospira]|uniref:RNase III domain-containing protein n=1 Tax=Cladophialophora chaetospira TaxID=386627 RepID=A0AA38XBB8_9EURO|nr:hypothetical protein H2200_006293 [Cladophialophora chaetospira]
MGKVLEKVKQCEAIIDYEFKEKHHGVEALFTYTGNCQELGALVEIKKNDGLGILGDIILQDHLCRKWLELGLSKKDWSRIRQEVASNANLAAIGKAKALDACVVLNPGQTAVQDSIMATTVEAIIGAVDLDGGKAAAEKVIERLSLSHDLLKPATTILP